jgi:hypothetical protein
MPYTCDGNNEDTSSIIHALSNAIDSLKDYPEACTAYLAAENLAIRESKWIPDMLNSLLIALKMQKELLETLTPDQYGAKAFEEVEKVTIEAAGTITEIIKNNPTELKNFLEAQQKFRDSYNIMLEVPLGGIAAVVEFINTEIALLEKIIHITAVSESHKAIIDSIQAMIPVLQKYPEALGAFLTAEKVFLETRHADEWGETLLKSHILLLKAHRATLPLLNYTADTEAYTKYATSVMAIIDERKDIYSKLKNCPGKQQIGDSLQLFTEHFTHFLANPSENLHLYTEFLDTEISQLEPLTKPETLPVAEFIGV